MFRQLPCLECRTQRNSPAIGPRSQAEKSTPCGMPALRRAMDLWWCWYRGWWLQAARWCLWPRDSPGSAASSPSTYPGMEKATSRGQYSRSPSLPTRSSDANALPEAHFAGNSFGCQILAALAVRHPKRVNRLVLQGPTVDPAARGFWPQFWRQVRNGCIEHSSLGRVMIRDYRAAGLRRVWATIQSVLADRIEEKLPQVQAPTLVMRGDKDVVVPQRWAEQVTQLLPHGKLCVVSSAAHTLNYTAPIEFIETIRPFFHL
jgi:pimeloyl-ACP methyl ester carboxylesterase